MISVNNNLAALQVSRSLNSHYSNLAKFTQRLSSGLRINSAADDAAGLAIRELQRADLASLHQGMRNANDAISLIQTADGALAIIDEKLIRMKELAMQAATGTYNSTQRLMIDSEFQAMAAEIDRIANATDFNGVKLLDGSLSGKHDGSQLESTGELKVHFGSGNDSAEDYYYIEIGDATLQGLGLRGYGPDNMPPLNDLANSTFYSLPDDTVRTIDQTIPSQGKWYLMGGNANASQNLIFIIPKGTKNIVINTQGIELLPPGAPGAPGDQDIQLFTRNGVHLAGTPLDDITYQPGALGAGPDNSIPGQAGRLGFTLGMYNGANLNQGPAVYDPTGKNLNYTTYNGMTIGYSGDPDRYDAGLGFNDSIMQNWNDYEVLTIDEAKEDLLVWVVGIWAGDIKAYWDGAVISIETQDKAQRALEKIDEAIVKKDQIRAHLGALQNRFENTVSNISIQSENLQASESRISDVDVATTMTEFVRNQILTQSAVAMLSQANSLPQMLMQLIG